MSKLTLFNIILSDFIRVISKNVFTFLNSKQISNVSGNLNIINNIINKSNTIRKDFDALTRVINNSKTGEGSVGEVGKKL